MWRPRPVVRSWHGWRANPRARSSSWAAATLALGLLAASLGISAGDSWGIRPSVAMPAAGEPLRSGVPHPGSGSPDAQLPGAQLPEVMGRAAEGTKLTTRAIEQLRVGDRVLAQDPETGETTLKRVTRVFQRRSDHLRRLRVQAAGQPASQWLETTNEHPFWVEGTGWVPAGNLQVGNRLRQVNGPPATLVEIGFEQAGAGVPVFNIETEDFHTYFVSADERSMPLLVHNCNPDSLGKLYHYTSADPSQILAGGLRPGASGKVFLTSNGKLSPLQAHVDLALPPNRGLAQHLVEIDIKTLRELGIELPDLQRVGRRYNMPGGGWEVGVPDRIPPAAIQPIR